jgi:hypothetical protein
VATAVFVARAMPARATATEAVIPG